MAFSVSPTPSYPSLPYSKGPRSAYYTNEKYLKLFLNVAQPDTDDEWGRTEAIAVRSLADHVTDIWENLYGPDPTVVGAGLAGNITEVLKIVDITNSRIVLPKGTGPASSNTASATRIKDGQITFDTAETTGLFCAKLVLGNNFELRSDIGSATKFLRAHGLENFYIGMSRTLGNNSITLNLPTGVSDAGQRSYVFGEAAVAFDTSSSFSAGNSVLSSLSTGTGTFSTKISVGSSLDIVPNTIYYCAGSGGTPQDWMVAPNRFVLGPQLSSLQRIEVNNEEGLSFYCGDSGSVTASYSSRAINLHNNSGVLKFFAVLTEDGHPSIGYSGGSFLTFCGAQSIPSSTKEIRVNTDVLSLYDIVGTPTERTEVSKDFYRVYSDSTKVYEITPTSTTLNSQDNKRSVRTFSSSMYIQDLNLDDVDRGIIELQANKIRMYDPDVSSTVARASLAYNPEAGNLFLFTSEGPSISMLNDSTDSTLRISTLNSTTSGVVPTNLSIVVDYFKNSSPSTNEIYYKEQSTLSSTDKVLVWNG